MFKGKLNIWGNALKPNSKITVIKTNSENIIFCRYFIAMQVERIRNILMSENTRNIVNCENALGL